MKHRQVAEMKEIGKKIYEYENQMQIIMQEKDRLDQTLRSKSNELMEATSTIDKYEYEIDGMKRAISSLEGRAQEANELNEKVYQYEMTMREMGVKIQSLQRDQQALESVSLERDALKKKVRELSDVAIRITDYEYQIEDITKQIDRLNMIVETKNR